MLKETPHALVKFQVYTSKGETTYDDRRLNRVKTRNTIPFGPWARMIHESILFCVDFSFIVEHSKNSFSKNFHCSLC